MYLSRLILNVRHRQVRTDLARPYELHRTLLRAFPDRMAEGAERLLYRVEQAPGRPEPFILVQSYLEPDWGALPLGYLVESREMPNPAVKAIDFALRAGEMLNFRLLANPTKRLSRSLAYGREKSKRVGLYREEEQLAWLERKGQQHGFQVLYAVAARQERYEDHVHQLTIHTVQFDGYLSVTDPTLLHTAVINGIGSGKAFGCGLLSLARSR